MAEQNVGSIVYEISAEVQPLLQGGKQANKVLAEIESALDENIAKFKKLDAQVTTTAQAVNTATRNMGGLRNAFGQLGYQIQDVAVQLQMGQNALIVFAQQGSQIASIFGPGGAVVGAIIAIGGAIAGALIPSLFDSADATKQLETAQKSLSDTVVKTDSGVSALSDKIQRLAAVSADAAKAQIAVAMTDAQQAISAAGNVINDQVNDLGTWRNSMEAAQSQLTTLEAAGLNATSVLKDLGGTYEGNIKGVNILNNVTTSMADTFGITQTQAVGLVKVFRDLSNQPTADNMQAAATALSSLSEQTGYANPKLNELTNIVNQNYLSAANASDAIKVLKDALNNLTGAADASKQALSGNAEQLNKLVEAAKNEAATVGFSAREKAKYVASLLGATEAEKKSIDASYDKIEAYQKETKAQQERDQQQKKAASERAAAAKQSASAQAAADKQEATAKQQIIDQIDRLSAKYQIAVLEQKGMSQEAAELAARQQLGAKATESQVQQVANLTTAMQKLGDAKKSADSFGQIQASVSPVAAVDNKFQQQMQQLNQYATYYPQKIAEVEATRAAIEQQYRQQRLQAMWDEWSQQSVINQAAAAGFESLANNASNAFTGIITGSMSAQEAMQSLASNALNSLINGFVQMGVEWVKSAITGSAAQIGATAATTSASVAGIATTTAASTTSAATTTAAWLPAAAAASIGSFGGAAAIGIGALIAGMALAGGLAGKRKNGGPVSGGSMYQVGEGGMPEIYQASTGKQYMIPGDNGRVISNKDIQGGGGAISVNIQFFDQSSGSHSYDAQASQDGDTLTVQAFIRDMDQGGPMRQSITRNTSATPRATE
ncbi:phage tail length tape measure family protein [Enterobacteriaceae bacterium C34A]